MKTLKKSEEAFLIYAACMSLMMVFIMAVITPVPIAKPKPRAPIVKVLCKPVGKNSEACWEVRYARK